MRDSDLRELNASIDSVVGETWEIVASGDGGRFDAYSDEASRRYAFEIRLATLHGRAHWEEAHCDECNTPYPCETLQILIDYKNWDIEDFRGAS